MSLKNVYISTRLDDTATTALYSLSNELDTTNSEIVRRSVKLLRQLYDIEKSKGEIFVRTKKGESVLVWLG